MGAIAKWGGRIKFAFVLTVGSFVTMFLLVAMVGEDYNVVLENVFLLLTLTFVISGVAIPFLVYFDSRAIKREDGGWSPRPWFWFFSIFLFYGLPFLMYMYYRRKNVEAPTPELGEVLLEAFPFSTLNMVRKGQSSSVHEATTDRDEWTLILKASTLVFFLWFLVEGYLPSNSTLASIFAVVASLSYITIAATVWLDGQAVSRQGDWEPTYQGWAIASFLMLAFPALLYLALRKNKVGSLGPPLVGAISSAHLGNLTRPILDREMIAGEARNTPDPTAIFEEAEEHLQQAEQLLANGRYVKARDRYRDALAGFEDVEGRRSKSRRGHRNLKDKIATAERGIETCWICPLTEKVDEAEGLLESGQVDAARSIYEQVADALEARTFEYAETQELLHRVGEGLERTNPDGTE